MTLEEKTCGLLRWDGKRGGNTQKEISLLTSTQLFDPKNEMIDNESINRVFTRFVVLVFQLRTLRIIVKRKESFPRLEKRFGFFYY